MCLLLLLLLLSISSYSQFRIGTGLAVDNHYFVPALIELQDDILVTTPTHNDSDLFLFLSKPLKGNGIWIYSLDIRYYKKYQSMFVIKTDPTFIDLVKRVSIASGNIQLLGNVGLNPKIRPFRKIKLLAGLGPSFYFNLRPDRVNFIDAPELDEPFYQAQKIHRNFSLIYNLRITWQVNSRFGLSIIDQGNITPINNPISLNGDTFDTRTRWRNLGILITYTFNP